MAYCSLRSVILYKQSPLGSVKLDFMLPPLPKTSSTCRAADS